MSSEQRTTIACPICGNVNSYQAQHCIKCGLDLDPIRAALSQAETVAAVGKIGSPQIDGKSK